MVRQRRVLILGLNYPPEPTGIAPYTGAMTKGLARRRVQATALTSRPHYPGWKITSAYGQWLRDEQIDGVRVVRLWHYVPRRPTGVRRALSELSFGVRLVAARWRSPDVIVAVSPALLATLAAVVRARLFHRHTPIVVWVQDLYSLGLAETGQGGRSVVCAMTAIERWVLRHASRVIVIHERFAARVAHDLGVAPERIDVVRNWTHLRPAPRVDRGRLRRESKWADDETIVLHAGNMGVKQGLDNVVEAARLADARGDRVRFVLLGGGGERDRLRELGASIRSLEFIDPLPEDRFVDALQTADILLVNEKPGVAEMAVPSKLTSYFNVGKPVLAATEEHSITADEIRSAGAGIVVPPESPAALLDAALDLAADPAKARNLGENGLRYRRTVLDEDTALDKFTDILDSLTTDGTSGARTRHQTRKRTAP